MTLPVTIDPRYHDAVIFGLDGAVTDTATIDVPTWAGLMRQLRGQGIATAGYASNKHAEQVFRAAGLDDLFPPQVGEIAAGRRGVPGPTPWSPTVRSPR